MPNRKRKTTRKKRGGSSVHRATEIENRGKPNNGSKIVAFDFKRKKRFKNPSLHIRRLEEKLEKYLMYLKRQLTPEQYLMVLEAVASAGHHRKITEEVLIKHLKAIHNIT